MRRVRNLGNQTCPSHIQGVSGLSYPPNQLPPRRIMVSRRRVRRPLPAAMLAISDARDRWLSYLNYAKPSSFRSLGHAREEGRLINLGGIIDLALVSANECLECAGKEY